MFILATWNGPAYEMEMHRFDNRDDAELAAYTWMIGMGIIGSDLPIDDMLAWWFEPEGGREEDFSVGCEIREVK